MANLKLFLALAALWKAILAAFKKSPSPTSYPAEHLPDGHPDAVPPHSKHQPKYPTSTAPGTFNRDTGTWNP